MIAFAGYSLTEIFNKAILLETTTKLRNVKVKELQVRKLYIYCGFTCNLIASGLDCIIVIEIYIYLRLLHGVSF